MIKLFSSDQIKAWDAYTIRESGITSFELMQRACKAFTDWFTERFDASSKITIVCGSGNNGGDGLGVALLLHERGYPVQVYIIRGSSVTTDFDKSQKLIEKKIPVTEITAVKQVTDINSKVVIDALFGTGLSRPLSGLYAEAVKELNKLHVIRIAIDVPSGLRTDAHSAGEIFKAHYTITFQAPKLAFLLPENQEYVGDWQAVDIGLSKKFVKETHSTYAWVNHKFVVKLLKPRLTFSHKGSFGHALLIAGSKGKMGAAVLAARAALRAGVGLLTVHVPSGGSTIMQVSVPEAMTTEDALPDFFSGRVVEEFYSVVGVGPGLGTAPETVSGFEQLLRTYKKPMVIDADALNMLAAQPHLQAYVPEGSILTPHPGEFKRLVGAWQNDFDKLEKLQALALKLQAVVILKGAYSAIALPDGNLFFNSTGNPGMATGGSGDVLTGVLTSLLAQGYSAKDAAVIGVFVHGLAGDLAAHKTGQRGLIAGDLVQYLSVAFKKVD